MTSTRCPATNDNGARCNITHDETETAHALVGVNGDLLTEWWG